MDNGKVSSFGTFGGYMYDSFGGYPKCNNTMVTPHISTASNDNNNSSTDTASTKSNNRDSTTTTMANTSLNTVAANDPPDIHKSKWVINLLSTPSPTLRKLH